ncbi:MAG: methyltransferase [Lachnospiraceae bacterium]|nr:methyltransferase [Lachnospiraceae bacterium]
MNKNMVLIQLCIPVTGASYDIWLPKTVSIGQATDLVAGFFAGTAGGAYIPNEETVLCSMEDGRIYNINSSVEELHLKNGSKLMLI